MSYFMKKKMKEGKKPMKRCSITLMKESKFR